MARTSTATRAVVLAAATFAVCHEYPAICRWLALTARELERALGSQSGAANEHEAPAEGAPAS